MGKHGDHGNLKAQSQKYQQVKTDKKGIMQNTSFHYFSKFYSTTIYSCLKNPSQICLARSRTAFFSLGGPITIISSPWESISDTKS